MKDRLASLPVIGTALSVQERYQRDAADPLAASIGFFGFLSLFPLLALAVSVTGFVLDDPADQQAVAETITEAIPALAATMEDETGDTQVADLVENAVDQRGTIGVVGLITLLLAGLKVVNGAMISTRVVLRGAVLAGLGIKLRQIGALFGLGTLALLAAGASSLAGIGLGQLPGPLALVVSVALTFVLDLALFLGAYVLLSPSSRLGARDLLPGAVLGAAGWMVLKIVGANYVGNQVEDANALYGALGGVVALMLLLYLAGRLYLYGAELAAVRYERTHGRLVPPPIDADERTAHHQASGPPPIPGAARRTRPADPGSAAATPTVGAGTRTRLEAAEARRHAGSGPGSDPGGDLRRTVALGLGVAALAAGWRWLRDDRE